MWKWDVEVDQIQKMIQLHRPRAHSSPEGDVCVCDQVQPMGPIHQEPYPSGAISITVEYRFRSI